MSFSSARGAIGLASSARGSIGLDSSARGNIGLPSSARGNIGLASSARGGIGAIGLSSSARGGIGGLCAPRGGMGISAPAAGSFCVFSSSSSSSSSFKWDSWESYKQFAPSKRTAKLLSVLGALAALSGTVKAYDWLLDQSVAAATNHVDTKLVDFKTFQNTATGVHHEFVRQHNKETHELHREIAELRSRLLSLEQKEFDHRKELLIAVEIINNHQAEQDAAARKDPSSN